MEIKKIVITGGPCAGKSTAMGKIQKEFEQRGWKVLFVSETSTELITGGVTPWGCSNFQESLMKLQIEKERVYVGAARQMGEEKVLIVYDRGIMDNKAYMPEEEFVRLADTMETNPIALRDWYDAVFHLVTTAKGAEDYYTTENNQARTETPKQAAELDDRLIAAWTGHPHLRIIDNSTDFDGKMFRLIKEIALFLGEPEPYEIERKFLIEYPDIDWLNKMNNCQKVDIIQTYLEFNEDREVRIRQRGADGNYSYYLTTKERLSGIKRIEKERKLSQEEYLSLLMKSDTNMHQVRKTRYCFVYKNQYFELDVYPFWNAKAIVEIELSDEQQEIELPKEIQVIKEVTDDLNYKNAALALNKGICE